MDRYRDIMPDYQEFRDALRRPLPRTARVNTVKADRRQAIEGLRSAGVVAEPLDWYPQGLSIDARDTAVGNTLPHYNGWIHVQEEVSMIPPVVLDQDPDDQVLDLCAAPGGKTAQLAEAADIVVANDDDIGRLAALRNNTDRLGVTNVAVTSHDGRRYPAASFDAALVDAPCSSEGTARKLPQYRDGASMDEIIGVQPVQKGLLKRAVELVEPGGTVVYSTCTFAPEENEAVIDHVADKVEVEEFSVGLESSPGVTEWNGETYAEEVRRARRFYPHQNDTGGFFVAELTVK